MQTIDELLREGHRRHTPLDKLIKQAADQTEWTAAVQALLPKRLRQGIRVTEVRGAVLTVACGNAAIATRLRFEVPNLLPRLRALQQFAAVADIRLRVAEGQPHDFDPS